jgi:hypothetical protein
MGKKKEFSVGDFGIIKCHNKNKLLFPVDHWSILGSSHNLHQEFT